MSDKQLAALLRQIESRLRQVYGELDQAIEANGVARPLADKGPLVPILEAMGTTPPPAKYPMLEGLEMVIDDIASTVGNLKSE